MNEIIKRIGELRHQASMINFQSHLSADDYDYIEYLENEIAELYSQLKGVKLVALELKEGWYLTADRNLCYCDEPTWFDSEEEAMEYFRNADLYHNQCTPRFEWKEF